MNNKKFLVVGVLFIINYTVFNYTDIYVTDLFGWGGDPQLINWPFQL